jgi:hypothetical protein
MQIQFTLATQCEDDAAVNPQMIMNRGLNVVS